MDNKITYLPNLDRLAEIMRERHGDNGGEPPDNGPMEARIAKLEASGEFVRVQLTELRADVRELRADMKLLLGALVAVALGLAGLMAKGFHWL